MAIVKTEQEFVNLNAYIGFLNAKGYKAAITSTICDTVTKFIITIVDITFEIVQKSCIESYVTSKGLLVALDMATQSENITKHQYELGKQLIIKTRLFTQSNSCNFCYRIKQTKFWLHPQCYRHILMDAGLCEAKIVFDNSTLDIEHRLIKARIMLKDEAISEPFTCILPKNIEYNDATFKASVVASPIDFIHSIFAKSNSLTAKALSEFISRKYV